jgi:GT2 family glycosyltransferase
MIARMNTPIAIVNHNTREHLRACLQSLAAERPAQLIVVDHASTEGSDAMLRAEFPAGRPLYE